MNNQLRVHLQELSRVREQEQETIKHIKEIRDSLTIGDVTFPDHFEVMNFAPTGGKVLRLLKIGPEVGCLMSDTSKCRCAYTYMKVICESYAVTFQAWFACINDFRELLCDNTITHDEIISITVGAAKWAGIKRIFTGGITGTHPIESNGIKILQCGGSNAIYHPFLDAGEDYVGSDHPFLGLAGQMSM